jgi:hypothetical protein
MTGVTELISVNLDGEPAWGTEPSISADGRYVAFSSPGNDLVAGDANGFVYDVFVRDRVAGKTALVSIRADGVQGDGHSGGFSFGNEYDQAISADGRYIAFRSYAQNLVPGDQFSADILIKDMWSGSLVAASISAAGQFSGEDSFGPRISADGRLVAFTSRASNLVPGDTNNQEDVFVRDMLTGAFERLNVNLLNAQANGWAFEVGMSADGRRIAFGSPATDLVPSHYGSSRDIFLRTRALDVPQTYCAASANSLGCTPAIGFSGAPSFSGQTPFQVDASAVISHKLGRLVYSTAGSNDTAFAGGLLCLRAPLRWTAVQLSGGNSGLHDCSGTLLFDFGAWIASGRDLALTAGRQVWTQWFTRDGGASSTLSLSGGLTFVIEP